MQVYEFAQVESALHLMHWKYWTVLRNESENAFEDFMLFEMKPVTFTAPYNFDTYKADVVVPMQLVEMQCDSLLRETFRVGAVPRFHTYTLFLQKLFNLLANCGQCLVAHNFVNNSFHSRIKQQLWQSQLNRYSFVTQNFKLTLINTLRVNKKMPIFWKKNILISGVILEWCTTELSNLGFI